MMKQELNGYRSGSLQHYDKLKAWLDEEQHRLEFIKAHLTFTLATIEGQQVSVHVKSRTISPLLRPVFSFLVWQFAKVQV